MSKKIFNPDRGQFFWYVEEFLNESLPDLRIESAKFNPKSKSHKKYLKSKNCFLTETDAFESLM